MKFGFRLEVGKPIGPIPYVQLQAPGYRSIEGVLFIVVIKWQVVLPGVYARGYILY